MKWVSNTPKRVLDAIREIFSIPERTHWGRIGVATSCDGIHWAYDRIVLDDIAMDDSGMAICESSHHHSYPQVIKQHEKYYMITESYRQHRILFY